MQHVPLIVQEEKGLVVNDGTSKSPAELMLLQRGLLAGIHRISEVVLRVEGVVAKKLESRTMKVVRAAFGLNGNYTARGMAVVGRVRVGEYLELANGINVRTKVHI